LQNLPRSLCFLAENHNVVLALIEIKTQTRLYITFAGTIRRTRNVIDVNHDSATLRMRELDEFHRFGFLKKVNNNGFASKVASLRTTAPKARNMKARGKREAKRSASPLVTESRLPKP
jgi:hypothetical protein